MATNQIKIGNYGAGQSLPTKVKAHNTKKRNPISSKVVRHFDWEQSKAHRCFWTPQAAIFIFLLGGIGFTSTGIFFVIRSYSLVECKVYYDSEARGTLNNVTLDIFSGDCSGAGDLATLSGTPINIYYSLEGFYQNDAQYASSKSDAQLQGKIFTSKDDVKDCYPMDTRIINGVEKVLHPCGAKAWSVFNDKITLYQREDSSSTNLRKVEMNETYPAVSWAPHNNRQFKNPSLQERIAHGNEVYFWMYDQAEGLSANSSFTEKEKSLLYSLQTSLSLGQAGEGVLNSHFMVWMRSEAFPTFRKLYGTVRKPLSLPLRVHIQSRYPVGLWKGKKALIVSSTSWVGRESTLLGVLFSVLGLTMLLLCVTSLLKFGFKLFNSADIRLL